MRNSSFSHSLRNFIRRDLFITPQTKPHRSIIGSFPFIILALFFIWFSLTFLMPMYEILSFFFRVDVILLLQIIVAIAPFFIWSKGLIPMLFVRSNKIDIYLRHIQNASRDRIIIVILLISWLFLGAIIFMIVGYPYAIIMTFFASMYGAIPVFILCVIYYRNAYCRKCNSNEGFIRKKSQWICTQCGWKWQPVGQGSSPPEIEIHGERHENG